MRKLIAKIDYWLWSNFDLSILRILRWLSYVVIFWGLVKFDVEILATGALLLIAFGLSQIASKNEKLGNLVEKLLREVKSK